MVKSRHYFIRFLYFTHFPSFMTNVCFLICSCTLVAYDANNMDSVHLIRVHSVCFHDESLDGN